MAERAPLRLKVCGLRHPGNLRALAPLRPDYAGFIFYPGSKRYVGANFDPATLSLLPTGTQRVGVFVDAPPDQMLRLAACYRLDALQLHGDESPETCAVLHAGGHRLIKAFAVDASFDFSVTNAYAPYVDLLLFDTKGPARGGNGTAFDWSVLARYHGEVPFLLSGGIGPDAPVALRAFNHPAWWGIDVNSRFETAPGVKDADLLTAFCKEWKD